jgi:ectoine hydroxylase-related dioxygenase (phytanoyl-CoA dioxygenase family)
MPARLLPAAAAVPVAACECFGSQVIARCTGSPAQCVRNIGATQPPYHGGVTGWHQDSPAWPIILPNHMLSAWLPLDDALIENGCMW